VDLIRLDMTVTLDGWMFGIPMEVENKTGVGQWGEYEEVCIWSILEFLQFLHYSEGCLS